MIDRRALLGLLAGFATLIPALPVLSRGQQAPAPLPPASGVIDRIAFGSCNDQRRAQGFWDAILEQHPQLLVLMGDNVYGDVSSPEMTELREAYAKLGAEPGFRRVRERVPILPIWDDHDYGSNDAGGDFPYRRQSAALFRAFWGVPADSPRGRREGLYDAWAFGPAGCRLPAAGDAARPALVPLAA